MYSGPIPRQSGHARPNTQTHRDEAGGVGGRKEGRQPTQSAGSVGVQKGFGDSPKWNTMNVKTPAGTRRGDGKSQDTLGDIRWSGLDGARGRSGELGENKGGSEDWDPRSKAKAKAKGFGANQQHICGFFPFLPPLLLLRTPP